MDGRCVSPTVLGVMKWTCAVCWIRITDRSDCALSTQYERRTLGQSFGFEVHDRVEAALMHLCTAQARLAYEGVIHVPQEPGPGLDWRGVRAVHQAERAWIGLYQDLRLPYRVIRGSLEERLQQALDHFRLYPVMALAQAVELTQGEPGR